MSINAFYSAEVISTGLPQSIPISTSLGAGYAFVNVKNTTGFSATGLTTTLPVDVAFYPNGSNAATIGSGVSDTDVLVPVSIAANGLSVGVTAPMTTGTPIVVTAITAANPPVLTCDSTADLTSGQSVWVAYATGMQQIAQMPFTIEVIDATTFSFPYLDASGFAAPSTGAAVVPIVNYGASESPFSGVITAIGSSGDNTLVQTSVAQELQVGQMFRFSIPTVYGGMQELNQNSGRYSPSNLGGYEVVAYDEATNTTTFNVNSTGYAPFAFPSNAVVLTQPAGIIQSAQIAISGTYWGSLSNVGSQNTTTWYINLGSAVCGREGDVLQVTYGWLGN